MARKREDIFTRVARHLDPRIIPEELRHRLVQGDTDHFHWVGQFHPNKPTEIRTTRRRTISISTKLPRPYLEGFGNPARPLFAYIHGIERLDRWCFLRLNCGNTACINPRHYNPHAAFSIYEGRPGIVPGLPTATYSEEDVIYILEEMHAGRDVREFAREEDYGEALKRFRMHGGA